MALFWAWVISIRFFNLQDWLRLAKTKFLSSNLAIWSFLIIKLNVCWSTVPAVRDKQSSVRLPKRATWSIFPGSVVRWRGNGRRGGTRRRRARRSEALPPTEGQDGKFEQCYQDFFLTSKHSRKIHRCSAISSWQDWRPDSRPRGTSAPPRGSSSLRPCTCPRPRSRRGSRTVAWSTRSNFASSTAVVLVVVVARRADNSKRDSRRRPRPRVSWNNSWLKIESTIEFEFEL